MKESCSHGVKARQGLSKAERLLDYVRLLEGKSNLERRATLIHLLEGKGLPYRVAPYRLFGRGGVNIIVEFGNGGKEIAASAHYDAVKGSPGANDNASGVTVLFCVCARLRDCQLDNKVKALFFDGEEPWLRLGFLRLGCWGSSAYVRQQGLENLAGLYNLELCGMGDTVGLWPISKSLEGSLAFSSLKRVLEEKDVPHEAAKVPRLLFSGDHASFRGKGFPGALSLSLVPGSDRKGMKGFLESHRSIIKLMLGRYLGKWVGVPLLFQRIHSKEDKSEYLSEDALRLMANVLYEALLNLDHEVGQGPPSS